MEKVEFKLTRELAIRYDDKLVHETISIGGLEQIDAHTWVCHYSFPVIDVENGKVYGEGALHALTLCLKHIRKLIEGSEKDGTYKIWWLEEGDLGGFD